MHFYYNLNANIDENGANDHNVKDSMDKGNIEEREWSSVSDNKEYKNDNENYIERGLCSMRRSKLKIQVLPTKRMLW